uniref:Uncharacterized protein n=1 Tax=Lactuca sativa TaxID=4236 RepID=A0A9R1VHA5_LACSA|nr:hypothetical protein LSAT_V11C500233450 [Lactuca sativa]
MGKKGKDTNNGESDVDCTQYYDITMNILFAMVSEPYYLLHFLTFFSYFSIRFSTSQLFSPEFAGHLLRRELQALLAFVTLTAVKMVKEETWDGFVADMLVFAKIFPVGISLVLDYHLTLRFMLAFLGSSAQLTPLQLEALLTEGGTSKFWLMVKEETWDGFVADMLVFAKIFLVGISLVLDYHLTLWFMLAFLVIYIFRIQPPYTGLGSSAQLTPLQLEALLTEGGTSKFWLVSFTIL